MDFTEERRVKKLVETAKGNIEEALRLHWMWIKSGVITYKGSKKFIMSLAGDHDERP